MNGIVGSSISKKGMGPKEPVAKLLSAGIKVLSQPRVQEAILVAAEAEDPSEALSSIAKNILNALDEKAGGKIPPEAMSTFALELVETMADLVRAASGSDDESIGPKAMKMMLESAMSDEEGRRPQQTGERPVEQPMEQPGIVEQEMAQ